MICITLWRRCNKLLTFCCVSGFVSLPVGPPSVRWCTNTATDVITTRLHASDSTSRASGVCPDPMSQAMSSMSSTLVMIRGISNSAPFCSDPWKNRMIWFPLSSGFLALRIDDTPMFALKGRVHLRATLLRKALRSCIVQSIGVLKLYTDLTPLSVSQKCDLMEPHRAWYRVATSSPRLLRTSSSLWGGHVWSSIGTVRPSTNHGRSVTYWSSGICDDVNRFITHLNVQCYASW